MAEAMTVAARSGGAGQTALDAVKPALSTLPEAESLESLCRMGFWTAELEQAVNVQINCEFTNSYVYSALFAYFDRDNVALPGIAEYFRKHSDEERGHAELLMKYQNTRGGNIQLLPIQTPISDMSAGYLVNAEATKSKGAALYAMELALALESVNNTALITLRQQAEDSGDFAAADFIESDLLQEQVDSINEISKHVAQLRLVGQGLGVFQFDMSLRN